MFSSKTANSSPSNLAAESSPRKHSRSLATSISNSSPAGCPESVIDRLEAVEVNEEQGHAGSHPTSERALRPLQKQPTTRQAGQRVVMRLVHGLESARIGHRKADLLGKRLQHRLGLSPIEGRADDASPLDGRLDGRGNSRSGLRRSLVLGSV